MSVTFYDLQNGVDAVEKCSPGTNSNEGVHVGLESEQLAEPNCVKPVTCDHYRNCQEKLRQGKVEWRYPRIEEARKWQTYHVAHGDVEQRNGEHHRHHEPPPKSLDLVLPAVCNIRSIHF